LQGDAQTERMYGIKTIRLAHRRRAALQRLDAVNLKHQKTR